MTDEPIASGKEPAKTFLSYKDIICLVITGAAFVAAVGYMMKAHKLAFIISDFLASHSRELLPVLLIAVVVVGVVFLMKAHRFLVPYFAILASLAVGSWLWYLLTTVKLMDGSSPVPFHAGYFVFGAVLALSFCVARHAVGNTATVFAACFFGLELLVLFLAAMFTDVSRNYDTRAARDMAEEKFSVEFPDTSYTGLNTVVIADYKFYCTYALSGPYCRKQ